MEIEFDKEIDALLRQTARGDSFVSNADAAHLDADEIAAFAENAVPEKARQNYVRHLADCGSCRKKLSNLIALSAEAEVNPVVFEEKKLAAAPIPWYRRVFAVPNLVYALGALILLFSGIALYTVLQSNSRSAEVSQISEKQTESKGMTLDENASRSEVYSANSAMSNTATMNANSNASSGDFSEPKLSAPSAATNSNVAFNSRREENEVAKIEPNLLSAPKSSSDLTKNEDENIVAGAAPPPPPPVKEDKSADKEAEKKAQQSLSETVTVQKQATELPIKGRSVQNLPSPTMRAKTDARRDDSKDDDKKVKSAETVNVNGKTFKRENNVWYDAAYRGQTTKNITRGTNEYKKLDANLRGIAENLGGTIIVVWKEKAYRIQ